MCVLFLFCICILVVFVVLFSSVAAAVPICRLFRQRDLYFIFICSFNTFAVQFNWLKSSLLWRESRMPKWLSNLGWLSNCRAIRMFIFIFLQRERWYINCIFIYNMYTHISEKTLADIIESLKLMYTYILDQHQQTSEKTFRDITELVKYIYSYSALTWKRKKDLKTNFRTCKVYIFLININSKVKRP